MAEEASFCAGALTLHPERRLRSEYETAFTTAIAQADTCKNHVQKLMSWSYTSRKLIRESLGVVAVDSDVSSTDFHTDKPLMEDETEALSEVNDGICAVGSDTCH